MLVSWNLVSFKLFKSLYYLTSGIISLIIIKKVSILKSIYCFENLVLFKC